MTLTKKQMVREIGRRTRLKNRDVQVMLEAMMDVWVEELVEGSGRIELEGLFVIETRQIDRGTTGATIGLRQAPRYIRRVFMRVSRNLRNQISKSI